jgi:hypothetical protein
LRNKFTQLISYPVAQAFPKFGTLEKLQNKMPFSQIQERLLLIVERIILEHLPTRIFTAIVSVCIQMH